MKKGVPVSPGIAVARAFCVDELLARRETHHLEAGAVADEVRRFDEACAAAARELGDIAERVRTQVGQHESEIFQAHRLLVHDPALLAKVHAAIRHKHVDAHAALHDVLDEYQQLFTQFDDAYFRERFSDLRDVFQRVMQHLTAPQEQATPLPTDEALIVVAHELLPSQALALERLKVAGIVTETGGTTGHAAILARALGIPSVSGLRGVLREVKTGDLLALDGREGHLYLHPGPEVEAAYRKLQREYGDLRDKMIENRDQEAVTSDGTRIELLANVNGKADAIMAVKAGASGVGLYRTEYLFLTHPTVPTEEEQLQTYREVIHASPNRKVTIRTLDIGGDKNVAYLGDGRETNPFMGWRSIRLTTAHPEFFQTQLRAILRAGLEGDVSLLFPMVSTVEEVRKLKAVILRTCRDMKRRGIPFAHKMPLGIMVEVPAAALCVQALLDEVDFISIGSNDLIQYVMAADRDNPKVAHLCEPFNPAVLKVLNHVIKACVVRDTPVTLCGEMAGRPRCVLPLLGMGLRRLSMSPAFVPTIKELTRCCALADAEAVAQRVLHLPRLAMVRNYLTKRTREICPNVAFLDTRS